MKSMVVFWLIVISSLLAVLPKAPALYAVSIMRTQDERMKTPISNEEFTLYSDHYCILYEINATNTYRIKIHKIIQYILTYDSLCRPKNEGT